MRAIPIVLAAFALLPASALACRDEPELKMTWLSRADLVVVAQVSNYRVEPDFHDSIAAAHRYKLLQEALVATPEQREQIRRRIGLASDFARIDVKVEEVLLGTPPERLEVTWDTSWFKLPESIDEGSYLIALEAPGKLGGTPARARSWTVLSPICEQSFLIPSSSKDAAAVREFLGKAIARAPAGERTN